MHSLPLTGLEFAALSTDLLGAGHTLRFQARGGSMFPLIRDGDVIEVQPIHPSTIRRGDVVLCCQTSDRVLAHRVVRVNWEKDQATLVTQGDALARADGPIPADHVLGRVVAVERRGKRFRLDTAWQRWASRVWLNLAPLQRGGYRILAALRRRARGPASASKYP